jgi:nucleotide-binding universal stress UspA family protein
MTRLFVATDLTERTRIAERRAALIAQSKGWAIDLVHAVDNEQPEAVIALHREEAERMLGAACKVLAAEASRPCAPRVVLGDPAEALAGEAALDGAALIVLGPHRRRLIRDIFVGTTGERVIRAASTPVLSVHAEPGGHWRRMLLALDGSAASGAAVAAVRALGLLDPSNVVAIMAAEAPAAGMLRRSGASAAEIDAAGAILRREALATLAAVLHRGGFACAREVIADDAGSTAEALCQAAGRLGCDVIAMGTRGSGGIGGFSLGSVASAVLARAAVDVLVVPPVAL